ncbi:MAG: nitrite reductase/ring-hydroxylating ferredoxin subunit [Yoonia sp.]|jgi:nitrite reductase/ring-hydroxylating ferredoxin subunit
MKHDRQLLRKGRYQVVGNDGFEGTPLVLFRAKDGLSALTDHCPYRLVEISKGQVVDGEIGCPYHGWRFGGAAIAGHTGVLPRTRVKSQTLREVEGAVFVSNDTPNAAPYVHCAVGQKVITRLVPCTVQNLIDSAICLADHVKRDLTGPIRAHDKAAHEICDRRIINEIKANARATSGPIKRLVLRKGQQLTVLRKRICANFIASDKGLSDPR